MSSEPASDIAASSTELLPPPAECRRIYRATRDHPRVCAHCLSLSREDLDRRPRSHFENSREPNNIVREAAVGTRPRNKRTTSRHAGRTHCDNCGALNTTTPHQAGHSPSRAAIIEIVRNLVDTLARLDRDDDLPSEIEGDLPPHSEAAMETVTRITKSIEELTNTAVNALLPAALHAGIERAATKRDRLNRPRLSHWDDPDRPDFEVVVENDDLDLVGRLSD